jgi:hypothetical protein
MPAEFVDGHLYRAPKRPRRQTKGRGVARFLSNDYLSEAAAALNADPGFTQAITNVDLTIQFHVSGVPESGDVTYALEIGDGTATLSGGGAAAPDVTVTNDSETAVGISTGELNTQMAFMTGKITVGGNMAALLMNQAVITAFAEALSTLEVEY